MATDFSAIRDIIINAGSPGVPEGFSYDRTCVFMLLFDKDGELNVLAVQKTDNEGYPWRNQVALPGGHVDEDDESSLDAAYRELEEELDIKKEHVELMGSLGHFQTINSKDIKVFAGIWRKRRPVRFEAAEISRVLEIRVRDLVAIHVGSKYGGRIPDVMELLYPIDGAVIWGVTARILHHFIELVQPLYEKAGPARDRRIP